MRRSQYSMSLDSDAAPPLSCRDSPRSILAAFKTIRIGGHEKNNHEMERMFVANSIKPLIVACMVAWHWFVLDKRE